MLRREHNEEEHLSSVEVVSASTIEITGSLVVVIVEAAGCFALITHQSTNQTQERQLMCFFATSLLDFS